MPAAIPAIAAAWASVTAAAATFVSALAFKAGVMAGLAAWGKVATYAALAASLMMKPPGLGSQGQQVSVQMAGPNAPIPIVLGRTGTQGVVIYRATYGPSQRTLLVDTVLSLGPIHSVESFSVMGRSIGYSGNPNTGMATVTSVSGVDMKASKLFRENGLKFAHRTGAHDQTQTLNQITGEAAPSINSSHGMAGFARTILRCHLDEKRLNFPNMQPPDDPISVVKGVLCYDPRLDSTRTDIGGQGPHRLADKSTRTWSNNPYILGLNFTLGFWSPGGKKMAGLGAPIEDIDVPQWTAAANIADANNWTCNGLVTTADGRWATLSNILASGGGVPLNRAGKIGCFINTLKIPTFHLKASDVLGQRKVTTSTPSRQRSNTAVPSCIQASAKWSMIAGSPVTTQEWIDQDGGEIRTEEIAYPLVDSYAQAHQLAAYHICNSREFLQTEVTVKPIGLNADVGDAITIDLPELDLPAGSYWTVLERKWDSNSKTATLSLKAETPTKHAFCLGQSPTPPVTLTLKNFDPTNPAGPAPGDWEITDNKVVSVVDELTRTVIPAIVVSGSVRDPNAQKVIVETRSPPTAEEVFPGGTAGMSGEDIQTAIDAYGWTIATDAPRTAEEIVVSPLRPNTILDVAISYETRQGVFSQRRQLGNVTTAQDLAGGVGAGGIDWNDLPNPDTPIINVPPVLTDLDGGRIKAQFVALQGEVGQTVQEALEDVQEATGNISTRIEDAWDILGESDQEGLRQRMVNLEVAGPDGTIVARIQGLESREEGVASRLLTVEQTQTTLTNGLATKAESSALTALSSVVNHPTSGLSATNSRLDTTNVEVGKRALTTSVTALAGEISTERGRINGAISRLDSVDLEIDGLATVQSVNTLSTSLNTEKGRIDAANTRIDAVKITADGAATSSSVQQLTQTVNGHTNSISQISSVSTEANNRSKNIVGFVQTNGIVSGMRSENDGLRSRISFQQDVFEITPSAAGGASFSFTGAEGMKIGLNGQTRFWFGFRNV